MNYEIFHSSRWPCVDFNNYSVSFFQIIHSPLLQVSCSHVSLTVQFLSGGFLFRSLLLFLCDVPYFQVYFSVTIDALTSLYWKFHLLNARRLQGSPWFPPSWLHPRDIIQAIIWANHRAYFICFPSLRDQCPLFSDTECHNSYFTQFIIFYEDMEFY